MITTLRMIVIPLFVTHIHYEQLDMMYQKSHDYINQIEYNGALLLQMVGSRSKCQTLSFMIFVCYYPIPT